MSESTQPAGCRDAAMATALLLGLAIVFMIVGLSLSNQETCAGGCQTMALTLLYAGGPISAMFGVLFGGVTVAWPLEITLWVVLGFASARFAERHDRGVLGVAIALVLIALAYGLVLSQFVEIAV
ncbi:MAG: hypothetical protein U9N56_06170 [Actinomycetota bacterium]|nr:hypothetical protein [Actinomycetota bacterium]